MDPRTTIDEAQTLYQAVQSVADESPDREALVVGDERLTYRQLMQRVDALAAGLQQLGLKKGERVGVLLPTCPEFAISLLAPVAIGAVPFTISPLFRAHEVQHLLSDSGAAVLITLPEIMGHDYLKMIEAIRPTLPHLRQVIVQGGESRGGDAALDDLLATDTTLLVRARVAPDDMAFVFYTSGTTGAPKGAVHVHGTLKHYLSIVGEALGMGPETVFFTPIPLVTSAGAGMLVVGLSVGSKVVLMPRFEPRGALQVVQRERATLAFAVPVMLRTMLMMPDFDQYDLSSLQVIMTGGTTVPPDLVREVKARIGCGVIVALGSTEVGMAAMTSADDPPEIQATTCGRTALGMELKIVDEERRELPVGQTGEIACRSPFIIKGYYNRPEETAQARDEEGWFYTGDMAYLDEAGYVHFVDRKKDMLIRGGQNVYPAEVEHFLMTHPGVQLAAVIGVPSRVGGERARAYIIPKEGAELTETDILDYCRGQIAVFKIPDEVRFVSDLPMTAMRKVQKFALREQARQELQQA